VSVFHAMVTDCVVTAPMGPGSMSGPTLATRAAVTAGGGFSKNRNQLRAGVSASHSPFLAAPPPASGQLLALARWKRCGYD
jgi:hypothetical protein